MIGFFLFACDSQAAHAADIGLLLLDWDQRNLNFRASTYTDLLHRNGVHRDTHDDGLGQQFTRSTVGHTELQTIYDSVCRHLHDAAPHATILPNPTPTLTPTSTPSAKVARVADDHGEASSGDAPSPHDVVPAVTGGSSVDVVQREGSVSASAVDGQSVSKDGLKQLGRRGGIIWHGRLARRLSVATDGCDDAEEEGGVGRPNDQVSGGNICIGSRVKNSVRSSYLLICLPYYSNF
jgi:hypothetical protein